MLTNKSLQFLTSLDTQLESFSDCTWILKLNSTWNIFVTFVNHFPILILYLYSPTAIFQMKLFRLYLELEDVFLRTENLLTHPQPLWHLQCSLTESVFFTISYTFSYLSINSWECIGKQDLTFFRERTFHENKIPKNLIEEIVS